MFSIAILSAIFMIGVNYIMWLKAWMIELQDQNIFQIAYQNFQMSTFFIQDANPWPKYLTLILTLIPNPNP